jgi:hypothetical protein
MPYKAVIERIRAEFLEMPGLRLTAAQVRRLCGIDVTTCEAVLGALVDANFLRKCTDGTYARPSEASSPRSPLRTSMHRPVPKAS